MRDGLCAPRQAHVDLRTTDPVQRFQSTIADLAAYSHPDAMEDLFRLRCRYCDEVTLSHDVDKDRDQEHQQVPEAAGVLGTILHTDVDQH